MQFLRNRAHAGHRNVTLHAAAAPAALAGAACLALLSGCASPGAPLPPSLKLPEPATNLTAVRTGDQVLLHWTTPARTTDRLLVSGTVTAQICRETTSSTASPAKPARTARPGTVPCNPVVRVAVTPGSSDAADLLPASLTSGPPTALAYRVFLVNSAGRTAGPSAIVYAASGEAPAPITGLRATSTKPGVVLEWNHPTAALPSDTVELERLPQPNSGQSAGNPRPAPPTKSPLLPNDSAPAESHFRARDTGGAIDRTAEPGNSYRYTVQRVRQTAVQGQPGGGMLELRGLPSQPVEVAIRGDFPPDPPAGLIAAPAFSAAGAPAIDLSWEPAIELHISGYKLYRRQGEGPWQLLTAQPLRVAAYTDAAVTPGERYAWRVTAVADTGVESQPSAETTATVPAR